MPRPSAKAALEGYRTPGTVDRVDVYVVRDARRGAFLALSLAFTINVLAAIKRAEKTTTHRVPGQHRTETVTNIDWSQVPINIGGWGALSIFIFVMTDIEETAVLGQAFAWLIFLASLFNNGADALAFVQSHTGQTVNLKEHTPA